MVYINDIIGNIVDDVCKKYQSNEAIVYPEKNERYSYKAFKTLYDKIAKGLLKLGIKKGEHVALWAINCPEWISFQIATAKIGAVLVCINSNYGRHELEHVLNHSESTTLVLSEGFKNVGLSELLYSICPELKEARPGKLESKTLPHLRNVIYSGDGEYDGMYSLRDILELGGSISDDELAAASLALKNDDIINIYFTSGTTGNPKAVMSTHFAILNNASMIGKSLKYTSKDRLLLCAPLFHIMGCVASALVGLLNGAALVVVSRFQSAKVLECLDTEKCTALNGVPTMFKFLLDYPEFNKFDLSALRKGLIGGSYCHPNLFLEIVDKMNMSELAIGYGQTEAFGITQTLISDEFDKRIYTIGRGLPGVELKVINPATGKEVPDGIEGELIVKSVYLMEGYYKDKEATDKAVNEDKWLYTGDLAVKDKDGYCRFIGRIKEIIIRGGESISPVEIENFLITHPSIKEASIIGVPDKILGEEICAFIILKDGHVVNAEEIIQYVQANLAKYKIPKYIIFVDEFPTTSSGKIKKYKLKDYAVEKLKSR